MKMVSRTYLQVQSINILLVYYCYWTGVHCDSIDKETIIGIFLPSSGLKGTLPSEFGGLGKL